MRLSLLPLSLGFFALCALLSTEAHAQSGRRGRNASGTPAVALEDDDFDAPGTPPPGAPDQNPPAGTPQDPNQKKTAAHLLAAMDFHAPSQTLQAALETASQPPSPEKLEQHRAAQIAAAALSANWQNLREILASIPDRDAASALYEALLQKLAQSSEWPASSPPPPEARYESRPTRFDAQRRHLLIPRDVLGILAATPVPIGENHLKPLKTLVASAGPALLEPLTQMLMGGLPGLGGQTDAESRTRAARLLLSSRALKEAAAFLPLERDPFDPTITHSQLIALVQFHTQKSALDKSEAPTLQAALACAALAQRTDPADSTALTRLSNSLLRFLSQLEEKRSIEFLRTRILPRKELLNSLLNTIGVGAAQDLASTSESKRRGRLVLLHRVMLALSTGNGALPPSARPLALHWLDEAETSIRLSPPAKRPDEAREAIGRIYSFSQPVRSFLCFEREEMARFAPAEGFTAKLPPELAQRIRFATLRLKLTDPEGETTLAELRDYVKRYGKPGAAALAELFMKGWSEQRAAPEEDPEVERMRSMGLFIPNAAKGLPQTRSRQEVALRQFKSLVTSLEQITGTPLKSEEKAAAFIRIHSATEVFEKHHIEAVFGPAEHIDFPTLSALLQTMQARLAAEWSDTAAQQKAGTHRTESEVAAEASRGYSLAAELIRVNKPRLAAGWRASLQEAMLLFDAAEFHFKHQGTLVDYVAERKAALDALEKAAQSYTAAVPALRPAEWSLEPFLAWTSAMLGATDPKRLAWKENRAEPVFAKVHALLRSLPEPARSTHLGDFARLVQKATETVPAPMRFKFVDALIQVIGPEVPEIRPSLDLLDHYRSLTDEARLRAHFDGPTTVQHGKPFGVLLAIEHTEKLHRESGGFSKYLQNPASLNQNNPFVFFGLRNAKQMNYRDEFQKNVHKALQDSFEIVSITFHDPSVQPSPLSEPGWQATPLAYLQLRTKDASIDRLPPIQIDLEFAEGRSQVVLPVLSQLEPMATSTTPQPARPLQNLELLLTLDERDWSRGKLTLDIHGKGLGILPELQTLFHPADLEGFTLSVAEQENAVTQFVSDKNGARALGERNWQLTFQRNTDFHGDVRFRFPALREEFAGKVEYKHFVDADLFEIPAEKALSGFMLKRGRNTALRLALFLLILGGAVWAFLRAKHLWMPAPPHATADLPTVITPFSAIAFLRHQLETTAREDQRTVLQSEIAELERRCFSASPNPPGENELRERLSRFHPAGPIV